MIQCLVSNRVYYSHHELPIQRYDFDIYGLQSWAFSSFKIEEAKKQSG